MSEEKTKVVVVVEAPGKERRYLAGGWGYMTDGGIAIGEPLDDDRHGIADVVASYAPGAWLSVREDVASTGDPYYLQGKKLAIALETLREIARYDDARAVIAPARAGAALNDIADVDL